MRMIDVELLPSVGTAGAGEWRLLAGDHGLDSSQPYLLFREHLEPGRPVALAARHAGHLAGALHGVLTTARSALFSHPWKLLADDQMLRGADPVQLAGLRESRDGLIRAVTGGETGWAGLSDSVGEVLTVRGFDRSRVLLGARLEAAQREQACAGLLSAAMRAVRDGLAGAIAFPFVDPADTLLRQSLAAAGFRCGTVTGSSAFELAGFTSYDEYLARLPARTRGRYRREERELDAAGLGLGTVSFRDHAERITALEAQTSARHGGHPDLRQMLASRHFLNDVLPEHLRIPAVTRDGTLLASGMELLDQDDCYAVSYGCDYTLGMGSVGYHAICFYDPLSYCCDNGIRRLHLGFEAFLPKKIRGAIVAPLEMWLWAPDAARRDSLAALLQFISTRASGYLRQFAA
jgi:hypothetical protein